MPAAIFRKEALDALQSSDHEGALVKLVPRWTRYTYWFVVVLVVVAFVVGFVLLPSVQKDFTADGLWASICRAAGVPANWAGANRDSDTAAEGPRWPVPRLQIP